MEAVNVIEEILKILGIILAASIPGIYSLLVQRSKDREEKIKKVSEAENIKIDTAAKVQEIYQEMLDDIKKQQKENMEKIIGLTTSVDQLKKENTELHEDNRKLNKLVEKQTMEISGLKAKVSILIDQLKRLGVEPEVEVTRPIK